MARVVIDASDAVPQQQFTNYEGPTPPSGLYKVRLTSAKWEKASSGNQMLTVVLEFDTDNDKKKQFNGYAVWHRLVQVPQSMWRTNEFLTALGQPTKLTLDIDDTTGKVTKIGGARVGKVWLLGKFSEDAPYQGQTRLKVDSLSPVPGLVKTDEELDAEADGDAGVDDDPWGHVDDNQEPPF